MTDCHEIFRFPGIHSRDGQLAMRMREGYLSEKFGAFIALYPTYVGYFGYLHWCASPKIYAWSSLIHSLEIKVFGDNNSYYDHILMLFLLAGSRLHKSFVGPKPALDPKSDGSREKLLYFMFAAKWRKWKNCVGVNI